MTEYKDLQNDEPTKTPPLKEGERSKMLPME